MAWLQILLIAVGAVAVRSQLEDAKRVAASNNQFSNRFYQILTKQTDGNLLYSPFSISSAIAMLQAGAAGNTAREIQSGMSFPENDQLFKGYKALGDQLKSNNDYTLQTANSIFPKSGFKLKSEFTKILTDSFQSEVTQLDFSNAQSSAKTINDWVGGKTNGKITDLISPDSLDQDTRLVLVNAIYFKGLWSNKFDPAATRKADFHVTTSETVQVDMMSKEADFPYADLPELDAKAVALPYKGGHLSMLVLLPNQIDGLKSMEEKLSNVTLEEITSKLRTKRVLVQMPKFKIQSQISLNEPLKELGLRSMYSETANFDNIGDEQLRVSDAVHKAFIEVNEEGSEAAAATGVYIMAFSALRVEEYQLRINRPFYMAILSTKDAEGVVVQTRSGSFRQEHLIMDHPFVNMIYSNETKVPLFVNRVHNVAEESVQLRSFLFAGSGAAILPQSLVSTALLFISSLVLAGRLF